MKQKIKLARGRSAHFGLAITDASTGEAYQLESGEVIRFGVKKNTDDTAFVFAEKVITAADESGEYPLVFTPEDTASVKPGTYHYDIGLQSGTDYWPIVEWSEFEIGPNATSKE